MKFVSRGDTTVADAYLSPVLARYANRIAAALGEARLTFMTSNGGLAAPDFFRGKDAILSGPAGGVVAMAETAREAGFDHVIGFDMGGTSTDVSRFDGAYEREYETEVAGVRLRVPMMAIHTVAAGGGSILDYDGARFRAGPDSAGADPGPACYRRGGPLAVTDANVMVGKLKGEFFPHIFGPQADAPLDEAVVHERFSELAARIGDGRGPHEVADGFIRIAVENMANAIKRISVARGYDTRDYALNCFGGAGGQHACLVAEALGMSTILIHPFSGVLSAYGMKLAALRALRQQAVNAPLDRACVTGLEQAAAELGQRGGGRDCGAGRNAGSGAGAGASALRRQRHHPARAAGHGGGDGSRICAAACAAVRLRFRGQDADRRFDRGGSGEREGRRLPGFAGTSPAGGGGTATRERARFFSQGAWHEAAIRRSDELSPGATVDGPALLIEPNQTIVVEAGWQAALTRCAQSGAQPRRREIRRAGCRHHGRPCAAGSLRQPVHGHRRGDGRDAAEHRLLGEHQGAARLLLRDLRCGRRRWWPMPRTCPCIWARWAIA